MTKLSKQAEEIMLMGKVNEHLLPDGRIPTLITVNRNVEKPLKKIGATIGLRAVDTIEVGILPQDLKKAEAIKGIETISFGSSIISFPPLGKLATASVDNKTKGTTKKTYTKKQRIFVILIVFVLFLYIRYRRRKTKNYSRVIMINF